MNQIAEKYITGLKEAYFDNDGKDIWEHFESIKHGLAEKNTEELKKIYPEIPEALISLLEYVDGTYWREYSGEEITLFFLGSDMEEYPYYLLSSQEIIDNQHQASTYYSDYIERQYEDVDVDDKITNKTENLKWLHFSDCINNGGTSQLYIDFSPSPTGKVGQVVRYVHDPDKLKVIADSFEEYLEKIIENGYDFINEDILD